MKKFVRVFVFVGVVLSSVSGFAQSAKADKLFDKGVEAYNSNDFKAADSLFTLSAKLWQDKDVYNNLAVVNKMLGDQCKYCYYLQKANEYGDIKAFNTYLNHCLDKDTVWYSNGYYCVYHKYSTWNEDLKSRFFRKGVEGIDSTVLLSNNAKLTVEDYLSESFNIEKYIDTIKPCEDSLQPTFPGGDNALMYFFGYNLYYPLAAREQSIQGTVYVSFFVEADGTLTNIEVKRGIGGGCDEEAIRVIGMMPKWNPVTNLGKPIRSQYNLPVRFILHD